MLAPLKYVIVSIATELYGGMQNLIKNMYHGIMKGSVKRHLFRIYGRSLQCQSFHIFHSTKVKVSNR